MTDEKLTTPCTPSSATTRGVQSVRYQASSDSCCSRWTTTVAVWPTAGTSSASSVPAGSPSAYSMRITSPSRTTFLSAGNRMRSPS
ncbi:MAG: hypothetical protein U0W40_04665 [Acidimicrobiia bacterium]